MLNANRIISVSESGSSHQKNHVHQIQIQKSTETKYEQELTPHSNRPVHDRTAEHAKCRKQTSQHHPVYG